MLCHMRARMKEETKILDNDQDMLCGVHERISFKILTLLINLWELCNILLNSCGNLLKLEVQEATS